MIFKIFRTYKPDYTLGEFTVEVDGKTIYECKSLELPNLGNKKNVSCILAGMYDVVVVNESNAIKYKHFHILEVEGRSGIKIHIANYIRNLRGCIAPGKKHMDIDKDGLLDVTESGKTLTELLEIAEKHGYTAENKKDFKLIII